MRGLTQIPYDIQLVVLSTISIFWTESCSFHHERHSPWTLPYRNIFHFPCIVCRALISFYLEWKCFIAIWENSFWFFGNYIRSILLEIPYAIPEHCHIQRRDQVCWWWVIDLKGWSKRGKLYIFSPFAEKNGQVKKWLTNHTLEEISFSNYPRESWFTQITRSRVRAHHQTRSYHDWAGIYTRSSWFSDDKVSREDYADYCNGSLYLHSISIGSTC